MQEFKPNKHFPCDVISIFLIFYLLSFGGFNSEFEVLGYCLCYILSVLSSAELKIFFLSLPSLNE